MHSCLRSFCVLVFALVLAPNEVQAQSGPIQLRIRSGVALAMSNDRDTLIRISYPDRVSWLAAAERFRSWIIGGLWLPCTLALLFALQRTFRRRTAAIDE